MARVIKANLDEMVFEGREKDYGAYQLRKHYSKFLLYSLIIGIAVISLIPLSDMAKKYLAADNVNQKNTVYKEIVIKMADLPPPPPIDENLVPPPPPPTLPPPQVRTVAFRIPEPTPEEELNPEEEQTIVEQEELKNAPIIGLEDKEGTDDITAALADEVVFQEEELPEVVKEKEPDVNMFVVVEEEPKPINLAEIQKSIGFPTAARDANIEGSVVLRVLVERDGTYKRHIVLNSVHPILTKAVENEIHRLRFTPAIQGGKPIPFWMNIPINFKLITQ